MADMKSGAGKRLRWAARITTLAFLIMYVILFTLIWPYWWVFYCIPFVVIMGIAWVWSAPGGILVMACGIPALFFILDETPRRGSELTMVLFPLCLIFLIGGILHLVAAWRQRRTASSTPPSP